MLSRFCVASVITLLGLLAGGAAGAHARAPRSRHQPVRVCAVPRGARLVAQDARVRLITLVPRRAGDTIISREWRYCVRAKGRRFKRLVDAAMYSNGNGDIVDVGPLTLSGVYVAYNTETTADGGRYGNNPVGVVYVRNLLTGVSTGASLSCAQTPGWTMAFCAVGPTDYYCSSPYCGIGPPTLRLSADGLAAWVSEQECVYSNGDAWRPCAWTIQALDARDGWTAELDRLSPTVNTYLADPFANLQIYTCAAGCSTTREAIATWTDDDAGRSSSLR